MDTTILTYPLKYSSGAISHAGKVRQVNQDAYLLRPDLGLWVVADGMGGYEDGDIASQAIIKSLQNIQQVPDKLSDFLTQVEKHLLQVNMDLYDRTLNHSHLIGSTVVALLAHQHHAIVLWAGDSRAYRYRAGQLEQLTQDHSQVEELIEKGLLSPKEAETHPTSHIITRAVGVKSELFLDLELVTLSVNEIFLLCSDGLYREVTNLEIAEQLAQSEQSCQTIAEQLINLALSRQAKDNITIIVIRIHSALQENNPNE